MLLLLGGFVVCAVNTGGNMLHVIAGTLLSALVVNAWVARRSLRGLEVERRAPPRATRGEPVAQTWVLRRPGGRGLAFPVIVRPAADPRRGVEGPAGDGADPAEAAPAWALFLGLSPGAAAHATRRTSFPRTGRVALPPVQLACRAPFGLIERTRPVAGAGPPAEVLVLPRTRPLRPGTLRARRPARADRGRQAAFGPERRDLVRSLREHRAGDDARAIHWRSSARRGALVVKEFDRAAPRQAVVVLELVGAPDRALPADIREAAIELAASLLAGLVSRGEATALGMAGAGPLRVLPAVNGQSALTRALAALACQEAGPPALSDSPAGDAPEGRRAPPALPAGSAPLGARLPSGARVYLVTTAADSGRRPWTSPAQARTFLVTSQADAEVYLLPEERAAASPDHALEALPAGAAGAPARGEAAVLADGLP